ncbi:MAG: lytic transglycosylase domain-containing protein [Bacillota bacterium]|nr:lytic transglycosylase domain-containing protein [Bacillota bacterium]
MRVVTIRLRRRLRRFLGRLLAAALAALVVGVATWLVVHWLYPWPYRGEVEAAARAQGLSPYVVAAVIRAESGFRPQSVSHRGARGLMQVMPQTGLWAAEQMGLGKITPEQLEEPPLSIRIGTWYLAQLEREFGSVPPALAAYNAGRSNVERWLSQGVWDGSQEDLDRIPFPETRRFVAKVLRDAVWYERIYGR